MQMNCDGGGPIYRPMCICKLDQRYLDGQPAGAHVRGGGRKGGGGADLPRVTRQSSMERVALL